MTSPDDARTATRSATIGATAIISLAALEYVAVGAAMPTVAQALDGLTLYNMAFAATVAASVLGMVVAGWWCDAVGPRPATIVGVLTFVAGLLVCGMAPTMPVFVAGRGLQGLGNGMMIVAIYVVIAQRVPERLRPRLFAILAAAWVVPGLVGPLFTGAVVQHWGWRWVFLLVAPVALAALAVMMPSLAGTHRERGEAPAATPGLAAAALVAAVAVALLNLSGERVSGLEMGLGVILVGALALAARHLLPPGTLTVARGMPAVVAVRGLLGGSFVAAEAYLPLFMQERHHYSPAAAGAVLAVASITWTLGSWLQGRLADTADRYRVMLTGLLVYVVLMAGLFAAVAGGWRGWAVIVVYGLATLGVGLAYPTTTLLTMQLSRPEEIGRSSSGLQISEALATALGLACTGVVFGALHAGHPREAFTGTAAVALALGVAAVGASLRSRPATAA